MAKRGPDLVDPRLAKALAHPLRVEILALLRTGPSSPAKIQRRLENVSLNLVSHHIKVLKDLGCIELAETVNRKGATEHIYKPTGSLVLSDDAWKELSPLLRQPVTSTTLRMISADLSGSLGTGRFTEIPDTHLSRTPLKLDSQGWSEAAEILARTLDEIIAVGDRSLKRIGADEAAATRATVAIMHFPTSIGEGTDPPAE